MSRNNYTRIKNFGCSTVTPNYYSACLDNTVDAGFLMGANPQTWNSRSQECQSLLSQYVAENSNNSNKFDDISIAAINLQGQGFPNPIANCNSNFLISWLTRIMENYIFNNVNIATSVSLKERIKIKKLYNKFWSTASGCSWSFKINFRIRR